MVANFKTLDEHFFTNFHQFGVLTIGSTHHEGYATKPMYGLVIMQQNEELLPNVTSVRDGKNIFNGLVPSIHFWPFHFGKVQDLIRKCS